MNAKRKVLFVARDGTLIKESPDGRVDSFEKLEFVEDVISALRKLTRIGFELVIVSNQDGLGTESFPLSRFEGPHQFMLDVFRSQGVEFSAIHIDTHSANQGSAANRKPQIGMVIDYLKTGELDLQNSYVIGDGACDMELAKNIGIKGLMIETGGKGWMEISESIINQPRRASVERVTNETKITVSVDLDNSNHHTNAEKIDTGIGFFDHMLDQLSTHGGFGLAIDCNGDLNIDAHHTIEDVALALGTGIDQALGDRVGIARYGFLLAMDESLANVAIDLSGRPVYVQRGEFTTDRIGEFPTEMVSHFFGSFAQTLRAAIHVEFRGENNHHMVEAMFKGVGRALRAALARDGSELPSTKGVL